MIKLIIPGEPLPCARPRLTTRGGYAHAYDPQKKHKDAIKLMYRVEWNRAGGKAPIDGSLCIDIAFHMPLPSTLSCVSRNQHLWGFYDHCTKPDCDNLEKTVLDCLRGIAYNDDRQVIALFCRKFYSLEPRTEITIIPRKGIQMQDAAKEILGMFGPQEMIELCDSACELVHLQSRLTDLESYPQEDHQIFLLETACLLSRIADMHSKTLSKIAKKHPGFYLNCEEKS